MSNAWEHARRSCRRYEVLVRDGTWVLCQVRPWAELQVYTDANQAAIDRLRLEQGARLD